MSEFSRIQRVVVFTLCRILDIELPQKQEREWVGKATSRKGDSIAKKTDSTLIYLGTGASVLSVAVIEDCSGGREQDMQQKMGHMTHRHLSLSQITETWPKLTNQISSKVLFRVVEVKMTTIAISLIQSTTTTNALTSVMTRNLHMKVQTKKVQRRRITQHQRFLIRTRIAIL